jgi:aryl-alcohol dehydrogenase-like predicted oxidoreductase
VIDAACDAGITFFDTADCYGDGRSEEFLGHALQGRRDSVILATKFGGGKDMGYGPAAGGKGSRRYAIRAVDNALRRLRTDWIDLLQLHRPDPQTPIDETLRTFDDLIRSGKVRYVGCSNFSASQIAEAAQTARDLRLNPFISVQHQWSLVERGIEAEVAPAARSHGLGILPYFPLASGLLTGKVVSAGAIPPGSRLAGWASGFVTPERLAVVKRLQDWSAAQGRSLLEVAIGWLNAQPGMGSIIAGASAPEQVKANAAAADFVPDQAAVEAIGALARS